MAASHPKCAGAAGPVTPTNRPFPDPNQLVGSGRTFTSKLANWNDWAWDLIAIRAYNGEWLLLSEADVTPSAAQKAAYTKAWPKAERPL